MSSDQWQAANGADLSSDFSSSFTIPAPPKTDIWRRSDEDDVFNAPMLYQTLHASAFKKISVTVFAPWKTQYDQGGLVLAFPSGQRSGTATEEEEEEEEEEFSPAVKGAKWIKAGIEYFSDHSVIGVVGTDRYSDWSLSPMSQEYHQKATFVLERKGTTLWVYAAQEGVEKLIPMREVKWAFLEGRADAKVWVGVYAAKPTADTEDEEKSIEVTFSNLKLEREE